MTHGEASVQVTCAATAGGWRCSVDADDGRTAGHHEVTVSREDAERLAVARDAAGVVRLVEETFDFLLDREARSSILATFDVTVVSRYFPEYEAEISARLAP
ncbi:MAG: hypothetical protein WEC14_02650 [Chloroflexota bacterium]